MASPCIVLVDTPDSGLGAEAGRLAQAEAQRVEAKYSRYRPSIVTSINENAGRDMEVDVETADLLDYAALCHRLSGGRFDITSGALRRAWKFDRSGSLPSESAIEEALKHVGWARVEWRRPMIRIAAGMEIDLGGIGKEYAVDRACTLIRQFCNAPALVNFGGDLVVTGPRADGGAWRVAIEDVDSQGNSAGLLELKEGALATSGDAHRHVMNAGARYGHVLDPGTGWPVPNAPRSVTVHARTCSEAGLLAKLAILQGAGAEAFLEEEKVRAWCVR